MNRYIAAFEAKAVLLLLLLSSPSLVFADTVTVSIVNSQATPIYVSFTTLNQAPGTITWNSSGNGCGADCPTVISGRRARCEHGGAGRSRGAGLSLLTLPVQLRAAPPMKCATPGDCSPGASPKQDCHLKRAYHL